MNGLQPLQNVDFVVNPSTQSTLLPRGSSHRSTRKAGRFVFYLSLSPLRPHTMSPSTR